MKICGIQRVGIIMFRIRSQITYQSELEDGTELFFKEDNMCMVINFNRPYYS
jgi:hypothetical protein